MTQTTKKDKEKLHSNCIRQILQETDMTQQELADLALDGNAAHLSRIINGQRRCISLPIAIKISPDINDNQVSKIIELVSSHKIQGIVVSNTTDSNRDNLSDIKKHETGGLSGQPLKDISTNLINSIQF